MNLLDFISSSVVLLFILPICFFLATHNYFHLKALAGICLTTFLSEWLIKHRLIGTASPRPKGAKDCNLWCNDGIQEGKPGMPSSHSAEVAFFTGVYYYQTTNPILRFLLVAYEILIMASRYLKRCHTIEQIGVGTLFGLTLSVFFRSCVHLRA